MRTGIKTKMDNYKKQAIIWVLTIAVAIAVFTNANSIATENMVYYLRDSLEEVEVETDTEATISTESEAETEPEMENATSTESEAETEPEMKTATVTESEVKAEKQLVVEPKGDKWIGYDFVPGTFITGEQADDCAIYQDNTIISVIDENSKTITLESGETFEYLYADISHVTSYCPCVECCDIYTGYTYSGRNLFEETTPKVLAADLSRYPLGTKIFVPGYGVAVVEDCGGAIDDRELDVYIPDHDTAWNWGTVDTMVYIISFGEWN